MGNDVSKAADSASYFWQKPEIGKIGKVLRPDRQYFVGTFYRGSKSIVTEEELQACLKIIRAYRRYKRVSKPV
jgi:hypothetical protein